MTQRAVGLVAGGCIAAIIGSVLALLLIGGAVVAAVPNASNGKVGPSGPFPAVGTMQIVSNDLLPWVPAGGYPDYFPLGQCTYWAAKNHLVTWNGNADEWVNAPVEFEPLPTVGAIVVYAAGGAYSDVGHVAIVINVTSTQYTISEMNYAGLNVVDERTIPWPDPHIAALIP